MEVPLMNKPQPAPARTSKTNTGKIIRMIRKSNTLCHIQRTWSVFARQGRLRGCSWRDRERRSGGQFDGLVDGQNKGEVGMTAKILDGAKIRDAMFGELKDEVAILSSAGIRPGLAAGLGGDDPASQLFV